MRIPVSANLVIPAAELQWRFSRSSGPGGQHVNTTDTQVELRWDIAASGVLSDSQRHRIRERLAANLVDEYLVVVSSQHRSQLRNREDAINKLAALIRTALAPPPRSRKPTRPSRASIRRQQEAKRRRSDIKKLRRRPPT